MRRGLRHGISGSQRRPGATRRRFATLTGCVLALAVAAAGCAKGGTEGPGKPTAGGTATYALPANTTPNYIFPLSPGAFFSVVNSSNLQLLMYRPLYWFGTSNGLPYLNEQLSLAHRPVYDKHSVTITLKKYRWSNGEQVDAKDVVFWMNMLSAVTKVSSSSINWGGYVPHEFPSNVSSVKAISAYKVKLMIKGSFSRQWFTDNELSQITPMPLAWDVTSKGKSDCAARTTNCIAVFKYLDAQSQSTSTWVHSRLWSVVDGPWQLTGLSSQGLLTFSFNKKYSGLVPRAHIATFKELPFTSEEAEYNVLAAGGRNPIDVGYLPTVDAPVPPPGRSVGANPVHGYRLQPLYQWGLSYFPYNFSSADPQLPIISQVYFRHALQLLENQAAIIQGPLHGYGHVSTGPVGSFPRTTYLSPQARKGDPYPYDPVAARQLLVAHGWTVNPTGVTICHHAGTGPTDCGKGVRAGAQMKFTLYYATGQTWLESALLQLKSNAAQIGIEIDLIPKTFDGVLGVVENGNGCPAAGCPWELADWGVGWSYVPDYLPTGDELFQTGSFGNTGLYSNLINDSLIKQTLNNSNIHLMWHWENFLTKELPVVYQPDAPAALVESIDSLHIGTQNPTLAINPEDWYFIR